MVPKTVEQLAQLFQHANYGGNDPPPPFRRGEVVEFVTDPTPTTQGVVQLAVVTGFTAPGDVIDVGHPENLPTYKPGRYLYTIAIIKCSTHDRLFLTTCAGLPSERLRRPGLTPI